jgi:hypothetical protein
MAKLGANELCHCGSGKKYKRCCRDKDETSSRRRVPSPQEQARLVEFARKMQQDVEKAKYNPPKYHEVELGGQKIRIVGRGVYSGESLPPLGHTIIEHFKSQVLGQKWLEEEAKKPDEKRHIIIRWLSAWDDLRKSGSQNEDASKTKAYLSLTGETQELIALADDASRILQTENRFPKKLRERLINLREFQGARYELAVAATFIRCNFNVEWINDKTGPTNKLGKRYEFNAVHNVTKEVIAVEAKSRRRKGTLHEEGERPDLATLKANVDKLYKEAVTQGPDDKPFAIFIDINLPHQPELQGMDKTWIAEVMAMLRQYGERYTTEPVPFTFLFATNFAWHYKGQGTAGIPENMFVYNTSTPFQVSKQTFDAIGQAVRDYGKLPSGYLMTNSMWSLPIPEGAHHVTVDLTVSTNSQSRAKVGERRTIGQGYRSSYDAPNMVPQPVEIPVTEGTSVKEIVGIWYEPVDGHEGLEGFERFDVAPRTDEHKNTHFDLLVSSRRGVLAEVKIRVHILYRS